MLLSFHQVQEDPAIRTKLLFFLLFTFQCFGITYSYFQPPENWNVGNPKQLPSHVEIGFYGKGKASFYPSINFAKEPVTISQKEYVNIAKKVHEQNRGTNVHNLGNFQTKAGKASLLEMTTESQWGKIRLMQLILVKNQQAYVITASAKREEFQDFRNEFLKSFRTLTLTDNLFKEVKNEEKKDQLERSFSQINNEKNLKSFQKYI